VQLILSLCSVCLDEYITLTNWVGRIFTFSNFVISVNSRAPPLWNHLPALSQQEAADAIWWARASVRKLTLNGTFK
jgi:hypothetical protein